MLAVEAEFRTDGVADEGEWNPGTYEETIAAHEAAAVVDVEEGAIELLERAAVLAEAVSGGQVEDPDADHGEDEQAGNPDVASDLIGHPGEEEAHEPGDQDGQNRREDFGVGRVGVRVEHPEDAHHDEQGNDGDQGVSEKPQGFAAKFADGFALGYFEFFGHRLSRASVARSS